MQLLSKIIIKNKNKCTCLVWVGNVGKMEVTKQSNMEELNRKQYGTYIDSAKKGEI